MCNDRLHIDLTPTHRRIVSEFLEKYVPKTEIWAYGSRVKFTTRANSDLDLVSFSEPGQENAIYDLHKAFENSDLPFQVDILVWDDIPENFKKNIKKAYLVLQHKSSTSALAKGWQETTLGEFCEFHSGVILPKNQRISHGCVPVFGTSGITGSHTSALVDGQGIIVARSGTPGSVFYSPKPFWPLNSTYYIVSEQNRDLPYTYYLLKLLNLKRLCAEETIFNLHFGDISSLVLKVAPLSEQQFIGGVLGSLDDKISRLQEMSKTLEAAAMRVYKSWFVDFEPVIDNALNLGMAIPDAYRETAANRQARARATYTLPAKIRAIFPSEFEFIPEFGFIPKGWQVSTVAQEYSVQPGQHPPTQSLNSIQKGMPYFHDSSEAEQRFPRLVLCCSEPESVAKSGDTLLNLRLWNTKINMAFENCCVGPGIFAIRHHSSNMSFTYYSLLELQSKFLFLNQAKIGTAREDLTDRIKKTPCLRIDPRLVNWFELRVQELDKKIKQCHEDVIGTKNLLDALAPQILAGNLTQTKNFHL